MLLGEIVCWPLWPSPAVWTLRPGCDPPNTHLFSPGLKSRSSCPNVWTKLELVGILRWTCSTSEISQRPAQLLPEQASLHIHPPTLIPTTSHRGPFSVLPSAFASPHNHLKKISCGHVCTFTLTEHKRNGWQHKSVSNKGEASLYCSFWNEIRGYSYDWDWNKQDRIGVEGGEVTSGSWPWDNRW